MGKIDSLLRYHGIDVARCLAVLLFADAVSHLYGMAFGGLFMVFDHSVFRYSGGGAWMMVGVFLGLGVFGAVELWFASALWRHRPGARSIAVLLTWLALAGLVVLAATGPFVRDYKASFGGFTTTNPGSVFRVLAPLLLLPAGWVLLGALNAPATVERFGIGSSLRRPQ